jgi:pyruvate kinase
MQIDVIFLYLPIFIITGTDAILLGAETFRGLYPFQTISIVGKICAEVGITILVLLVFISHVLQDIQSNNCKAYFYPYYSFNNCLDAKLDN